MVLWLNFSNIWTYKVNLYEKFCPEIYLCFLQMSMNNIFLTPLKNSNPAVFTLKMSHRKKGKMQNADIIVTLLESFWMQSVKSAI